LGMGREDTESTDVSEGIPTSEVLIVGTIRITEQGIADASCIPGVVCRFNWLEDSSDTVIKVGLDKSRWREIPAGSDEKQPVADHSVESNCVVRDCGAMGQSFFIFNGGEIIYLCDTHWHSLAGQVYN